MYKGSDQAIFEVNDGIVGRDEVKQYQIWRYISSSEAVWRILGFAIHDRDPAVTHLDVHLEHREQIYFMETTVQCALEKERKRLTACLNFMLISLRIILGKYRRRNRIDVKLDAKWMAGLKYDKPTNWSAFTPFTLLSKNVSTCACFFTLSKAQRLSNH